MTKETRQRVGTDAYDDVFTAVDQLQYPDQKWWGQAFAKVTLPEEEEEFLPPSRSRTEQRQIERLRDRQPDYSVSELYSRLSNPRPMPRESRAKAEERAASWRIQSARERAFESRYLRQSRAASDLLAWNRDPSPLWSIAINAVAESTDAQRGPESAGTGRQVSPDFPAPRRVPKDQIRREYLETGRASVRTDRRKHRGKKLSNIHRNPSEHTAVYPTTVSLVMKGFQGSRRVFVMFSQEPSPLSGGDDDE